MTAYQVSVVGVSCCCSCGSMDGHTLYGAFLSGAGAAVRRGCGERADAAELVDRGGDGRGGELRAAAVQLRLQLQVMGCKAMSQAFLLTAGDLRPSSRLVDCIRGGRERGRDEGRRRGSGWTRCRQLRLQGRQGCFRAMVLLSSQARLSRAAMLLLLRHVPLAHALAPLLRRVPLLISRGTFGPQPLRPLRARAAVHLHELAIALYGGGGCLWRTSGCCRSRSASVDITQSTGTALRGGGTRSAATMTAAAGQRVS